MYAIKCMHFTNNPVVTIIQALLYSLYVISIEEPTCDALSHAWFLLLYVSPPTAWSFQSVASDRTPLPGCMIRGLAPRYARLTLAFLPSMMGFGSLQALSAAARSAIVTYTYTNRGTQKYMWYFQWCSMWMGCVDSLIL